MANFKDFLNKRFINALNKFPELRDFGYLTELKGMKTFKVAFGNIVGTSII